MKHIILIAVLFCNQLLANEQGNIQVVRVVDSNQELVTGARLEIPGTSYVFYSNIKGECYIPAHLLRQYAHINIHCVSYKTVNISTKEISSKITLEFR